MSSSGNVYGMMARRILGAVLCLALSACSLDRAHVEASTADDNRLPSAAFHEAVLNLGGDPERPVTLEVTLFTPIGSGPFPLAVMNHGATHASETNRGERYRFTVSAYYFLSRGYAVALPMMRGFAGSGGSLFKDGCDLATIALSNGRDIRAVIDAVAGRPDIDRTRIVVAGQSFGGWNTLGLGVAPPPGVRGLVAFNPAIRTSDCHAQDDSMAQGAGQLGARTALPSLWFYGENDTIMPTPTWRAVFAAYARAGGKAELVDVGAYKDDSHQLLSFPESLPLWAPRVDAFLARIGMPSAVLFPDFLPHKAPPATHWAALSDVAAVPYLNDKGRALYQHFLNASAPRAFVLSPTGAGGEASGGYDPLGRALLACSRRNEGCRPYAMDDDVVWTAPDKNAPAPARLVTKTVRMDVSTSLGTFVSVNPDCSPRGVPKVAIAESPAHGTATVAAHDQHPVFPTNSPYAACNAMTVPVVGVTYTPAHGYAGDDTLAIDETSLDGRHHVIRITLKIM